MSKRLLLLIVVLALAARNVAAQDDAPQWIVVTAPAFRDELKPLCHRRRAEGMRVIEVQTTDVLSGAQIRNGDVDSLKDRIQQLCRQSDGPNYVLLVGAVNATDEERALSTVLPPLRGTSGRMKGQPTDNGYGCLEKELMPTIAVGRFPARTTDEVRNMVHKTLAFEQKRSNAAWQNRLTLLVGNPGGASAIEKRFAEWYLQGVAGARFEKIDPLWAGRIVIHAPTSPYDVPDNRLRETSRRYLEEGQMFSIYLGHSNAEGFWSDGAVFLNRDDWSRLKLQTGAGVFFTCGCFGCQLQGRDGEGYGLAAMRNPDGPVAVIGSHGESYAALGQLAGDGMLECLSTSNPPTHLADYWLAAKVGIARGKMDGLTFWLYDQADGSHGTAPLDKQRLEHLEMWMLLGDPALKLPIPPATINLQVNGVASAGQSVTVNGSVPAAFAEANIRVTLERPVGSRPLGLTPLQKDANAISDAIFANHKRANDVVLKSYDVSAHEGRFECTIKLPTELPWPHLTIRAVAASKIDLAQGAVALKVAKPSSR